MRLQNGAACAAFDRITTAFIEMVGITIGADVAVKANVGYELAVIARKGQFKKEIVVF